MSFTNCALEHVCKSRAAVVGDKEGIKLLAPELFFFNFSTSCIWNVNNTGSKYVRIMQQTAFWKEKTESLYYV